jgi:hypothetical protein
VLVLQKSAQVGDQAAGPGDAVAGGDVDDEVVQPRGWIGELVAEVFATDERAAWVPLPAGRTQSKSGMPSQPPALAADPWRLLRRARA